MNNRLNKKIILGNTDVNIIEPIQHQFAWKAFNTGNANHWLPNEIAMTDDVATWKSDILTDAERIVIKRSMGFFSTADSIVVNNLVLAVYKHLTSPEARLYLLRQAYEEAIHTLSYQHIIESLGLDQDETYNMYIQIPSVKNKADWALQYCDSLCDNSFQIKTLEDASRFTRDLIAFYIGFEGIFFYVGFAQIFSLARRGLMLNTAEQLQYIMRDEYTHYLFGVNLINTIKQENSKIWTKDFKKEATTIIKTCAELEMKYAADTMPKGFLGLRAETYCEYIKYITNIRLDSIELSPIYEIIDNPFSWMDEMFNIKKEKNFFETRVTEYQSGGSLSWDD